jgi:uncharacterized protein YbjT (DUF2867 family)
VRVAVVGATGTVGRHTVEALTAAGHDAVPISRSSGVDIVSGRGLDTALEGVAVVVDVSNTASASGTRAREFFVTGARNLSEAEQRAGVRHHVLLSIIGIDRVPWGYYQAKLEQERVVATAPTPSTLLRTAQFHEFAGQVLARARRGPLAVVPTMLVQPVAARDVAAALVEAAVAPPAGRLADLAGPEQHKLADLVRAVIRASGTRGLVVPVRLPGAAGKAMASGRLLPGPGARLTRQTFRSWLEETA